MSHSVLTASGGVAVGAHPGLEALVLGVQHLPLLLPHRPAEQVGRAEGVPASFCAIAMTCSW